MEKTKILVVEDEIIVALDIKDTLLSLGFEVTGLATNYEEAIESFHACRPDILLTDIYLEESQNGIEIVKTIQKLDAVPVIYLTAYSDEQTITKAAKTNPVNYIVKPFRRDDLKSAIILGLYKATHTTQIHAEIHCKPLGDHYYFDEIEKILYFQTVPIKLGPKEKALLSLLVEAKGNVVSFSTIEHFVWPEKSVTDSTLRALIYRLRTKLKPEFIETIPSVGCRLITPL